MRRPGLVALALLALVLAATATGCGGGAETDSDASPALVTAGQVVGQFEREAGRPLQRTAEPDAAWEQLSYGLDPSRSLLRRYGIFSVYVAKPGRVGALDSLLRDKATRQALERDARGVYWELDTNSDTWVAYKRYAGNVVLVWFSESKERELDARWTRLDAVLRDLPR